MKTFEIRKKSTGQLVMPFSHPNKLVIDAYPETDYDYIDVTPVIDNSGIAFNQTDWLIDIGPFFDRFGMLQLQILANPDNENQAVIKTVMARKYIDLKRPDIPLMLGIIRDKNQGVTDSLVQSVLNTPVRADENRALRITYFNGE